MSNAILYNDTQKVKRDFWQRVQNVRDRYEARYYGLVRTTLVRQFKEVADHVTSDNMSVNLSQFVTKGPMEKVFASIYGNIGGHFAKEAYNGLKFRMMGMLTKEEDVDWYELMLKYVRQNCGSRITSITNMTRRQIEDIVRQVLNSSTTEGWGSDETARQLRKLFAEKGTELSQWRALRIARTEIVTASNIGSIEGARELNYPTEKYWIPTYDSRTRDTHMAVTDQNPRDINEKFMVGAYLMDIPGDAMAGPEETINCRCTIGFQIKGL